MVFACPEGDENYAQTVIAGVLRDRLSEAGYRFTQACLPQTSPQRYDFSHLEAALSQSTDLVVTMFARRHILAHLARRGVPPGPGMGRALKYARELLLRGVPKEEALEETLRRAR